MTDADREDATGSDGHSGGLPTELDRRASAAAALAGTARADPDGLDVSPSTLLDELRTELDRTGSDAECDERATAQAVRDDLLAACVHLLANDTETVAETDGFEHVVAAVEAAIDAGATGEVRADADERRQVDAGHLDAGTLRAATKVLFAGARDRPADLRRAVEPLAACLAVPDDAVRTWSVGALGHLAETYPDAVAPVAPDVVALLDHEETAVQHNAVEALATLARSRPDAVASAGETLGRLLDHEETAIQHNAAGVLALLAADHPETVAPAVPALRDLRDHDTAAVRRMATTALVRLSSD